MGYTTDFNGRFALNKVLDQETHAYLERFNESRRMGRNLGPEFGVQGEFYVDGTDTFGQGKDLNIIDYNRPPKTQPSLWCGWRPSEDGKYIEWDGGEKFYEYIPWLKYIITNFLDPKGYKLTGEVEWEGEDSDDFGKIVVRNNDITIKVGKKIYE